MDEATFQSVIEGDLPGKLAAEINSGDGNIDLDAHIDALLKTMFDDDELGGELGIEGNGGDALSVAPQRKALPTAPPLDALPVTPLAAAGDDTMNLILGPSEEHAASGAVRVPGFSTVSVAASSTRPGESRVPGSAQEAGAAPARGAGVQARAAPAAGLATVGDDDPFGGGVDIDGFLDEVHESGTTSTKRGRGVAMGAGQTSAIHRASALRTRKRLRA
jgi:hypothetical protein